MTDEKKKEKILGWKFEAAIGLIKAQRRLRAQIEFINNHLEQLLGVEHNEHHDGFSDLVYSEDPVEDALKKWFEVV